MSDSRGFLYTAFGAAYVEEARVSARSVRQVNPEAKICIVTDEPVIAGEEFDMVLPITPPGEVETFARLDSGAYYRKIDQFARSPFDRTIYLDSDTYVTGSLAGLFDLLDRYEMLVTHDGNAEANYRFEQTETPFTSIPKEFGCINTGVLAYRNGGRAQAFFTRWKENHVLHVQHRTVNDQPAMRLTLFESDLRYHILPITYNWFSWIPCFIPSGGKVVVIHGRNRWLFKWAAGLEARTASVFGPMSWRHLRLYYAAKILNWLSRKGIIGKPRFESGADMLGRRIHEASHELRSPRLP